MKPEDIELHIEELVLTGFPPGDYRDLGSFVEAELTRLLAEQGVPMTLARDLEIRRVEGGSFEMKAGSRPEEFGVKIAKAVYGGLER